jgi:16S rRNA (uracil1498-N3)-methyltransferase
MPVRAPLTGLAPGSRTLPAATSRHLCRVLRLREGDRFVAFDPGARVEAEATIELASPDAARVHVGDLRPAEVVALRDITLVYALAKGDKVDAVVRDATELGATRIVLSQTARSVARAEGAKAAQKMERWRRIAEQAARQCGRADPPQVLGIVSWSEALAEAASAAARYCLWERATSPLGATLPSDIAGGVSLAFAVGPEGGLEAGEVDEARALGFEIASLGRIVLRTETVPAAVLGAVRVLAAVAELTEP